MIHVERNGAHDLRASVCVIGSGAGGAVAAAELVEAGVDTILLEAGPHHDPASFDQREATMMERLYDEGGLQSTVDQSMILLTGRGLGGSTVHNTGLAVPAPEVVLEGWRRNGALSVDGAAFGEIQRRVLNRLGAVRPQDAEINANNRILRDGAESLGLGWTVPLHTRTECSGCGACVLGCAYNRKRNVLFSHLARAVSGGLRVVTGARARRIRRRGHDWSVEGLGFRVAAEQVIVAASALRTPALLRVSGLGERRSVGRSLRLHPFVPVGAVFDEEVVAWRGIPQSILVTGKAHFMRGERGGYILMVGAAGPAATAALVTGSGDVVGEVMRAYRHLAVAGVLLHDETRGRVGSSREGRPLVRYWPDPEDQDQLRDGVMTLARLFLERGAQRVILPFHRKPTLSRPEEVEELRRLPVRPYEVSLTSVHPQGSVPLGAGANSPVTPEGRLRGSPGVWVADGSLFPTSVGVPPQVTIMSLATIVAGHVAAHTSR